MGDLNYIWPLPQPFVRITSPFGGRINPISGKPQKHQGIDVAADIDAPIYSTADGTVKTVFHTENARTDGQKRAGNYVEVLHPDGKVSRYLHMSKFAVQPGQTVKAGTVVGYVGMTGGTTGPHLHFEIWTGTPFSSQEVDPLKIVSGSTSALAETYARKYWKWIAAGGLTSVAAVLLAAGVRRRRVGGYYKPEQALRPALANPRLTVRV